MQIPCGVLFAGSSHVIRYAEGRMKYHSIYSCERIRKIAEKRRLHWLMSSAQRAAVTTPSLSESKYYPILAQWKRKPVKLSTSGRTMTSNIHLYHLLILHFEAFPDKECGWVTEYGKTWSEIEGRQKLKLWTWQQQNVREKYEICWELTFY